MRNDSRSVLCSVARHDGTDCLRPLVPGAPFPICAKHLRAAWEYGQELVSLLTQDAQNAAAFREREQQRRENGVVYYLRLHGMVKIGTSINLKERLRSYGPGPVVLAVELGGPQLERMRHKQFAEDRAPVGQEYFHESEALAAHIAMLREHHGASC